MTAPPGPTASGPARVARPASRPHFRAILGAVVLVLGWVSASWADPPSGPIRVGVSLTVTGPGARLGTPMRQGIQLAIEDVNRRGGAGGHPLELVVRDSATPGLDTIGRQSAVARQYAELVADPAVVAVIGPQSSLEARAVATLVNQADLATVTPSATTFDLTDPTLATTFRPRGRTTYFRTVGTDLTQGAAMARFAHATLGVRRIGLAAVGSAGRCARRRLWVARYVGRKASAAATVVIWCSRSSHRDGLPCLHGRTFLQHSYGRTFL